MSIFNQVELQSQERNTFNLSHEFKFTANMGELIPVSVQEVLPGDVMSQSTSYLIRVMPLVAPVMHRVDCYIHHFYVPNRIVMKEAKTWNDFIFGGEKDGNANIVPPTVKYSSDAIGSLSDYLGLPTNAGGAQNPLDINAIPYAGYQKIYNDYYRDEQLIDEVDYELIQGDNTANTDLKVKRKRAWRHDYFTSALSQTQKGPEALIPLGTYAPIEFYDPSPLSPTTPIVDAVNKQPINSDNLGTSLTGDLFATTAATGALLDNSQYMRANLSNATASTITDLRTAFALQAWLERNNIGGSRDVEGLLVHFKVRSSDARLNRPEYLGGGKAAIQFSEVLQTSNSAFDQGSGVQPTTPQGNMAGHGITAGAYNGFHKKFLEEHGYVFSIMSIRPKTGYFQGIPKKFLRLDKFDYGWSQFAHIGEQPIQNREIYFDTTLTDQADNFGYVPRYSAYKFEPDRIAGEFKGATLKHWTLAREFTNQPRLNKEFIECTPSTRIWPVEDDSHKFLIQMYHDVKVNRQLPYYGTPKIK